VTKRKSFAGPPSSSTHITGSIPAIGAHRPCNPPAAVGNHFILLAGCCRGEVRSAAATAMELKPDGEPMPIPPTSSTPALPHLQGASGHTGMEMSVWQV
jgi:hypothetical protein